MSLPMVDPVLGNEVAQETLTQPGNTFVQNLITRLATENPAIAEFLVTFAEKSRDPQGVLYAGAFVYRLIEKQIDRK